MFEFSRSEFGLDSEIPKILQILNVFSNFSRILNIRRNSKGQNAEYSNSQLTFKRLANAFQTASEDHTQSFGENSTPATPQMTEFFELSLMRYESGKGISLFS